MSAEIVRPNVERILSRLKDFQQDTVERVFRRMYLDPEVTQRFLVADEVGLGKTLVARGVIARAIDHLWDKVERIDIIYLCSNGAIARQNINRLLVGGTEDCALPSRITLLPTMVSDLKRRKLNFVSLTPGTSFDLQSNLGRADERALLFWLLPEAWTETAPGAQRLLTGGMDPARFRDLVKEFNDPDQYHIDASIREAFRAALERRVATEEADGRTDTLRSRFLALSEEFRDGRSTPNEEARQSRNRLVGELRTCLASSCLASLEPDLIILDEFQRFKHLLNGTDEVGLLARDLFNFPEARILLLSATPYKMYTLSAEANGEDHYGDFLHTVRFLHGDPARTARFQGQLEAYRQQLLRLGGGLEGNLEKLEETKRVIEQQLRSVMVRTERLAVTADRNGMLAEVPPADARLEATDLEAYLGLQRVSRALDEADTLEYWKSAPYLLNFMDEYQIKRRFTAELAKQGGGTALWEALAGNPRLLLPWEEVETYRRVDPSNVRLRTLLADTVEMGAWRALWIPPALPYYPLEGPFADPAVATLTKRLVFSAWQVVPKVVATLLSYEAERRMVQSFEGEAARNTTEARRERRPLLRFSRSDDGLTGLPVMGWLYPSLVLAECGDPLTAAAGVDSEAPPLSLEGLLGQVRVRLEGLLAQLGGAILRGGRPDESWYWAAPILLDQQQYPEATRRWFAQGRIAAAWQGEGEQGEADDLESDEDRRSGWGRHVDEAIAVFQGRKLGPPPADLAEVLALMAVAGPAVVALRALSRVAGGARALQAVAARNMAGRIAWAFRVLFNLPEVTSLVRGLNRAEPYWRRVLEYCADGCLQSVMDEYVHILLDVEGLHGKSHTKVVAGVAKAVSEALHLRTASLELDVIRLAADRREITTETHSLRTRFAARFGGRKTEDGASAGRLDDVRAAFNSPFWPFVLCSTSVGQEGLDFHPYCHAIMHWNLPANPVDLEQREGRIHRYKGHAVRKNVARRHGRATLGAGHPDPWAEMFLKARAEGNMGSSDLVPFWLYPVDGGARIERHVPTLPLSREAEHLQALRRSLALYRMAFGQSRQEDLVAYLARHLPEDELLRVADKLRIDLSPDRAPAHVSVQPEEDPSPEWDEEGVDAAVADGADGASTGTFLTAAELRDLLDRFSSLVAREMPAVEQAIRLRQLLDAYAQCTHDFPRDEQRSTS